MEIRSLLSKVLLVGLMILQWVMKGMKRMFLIQTKEFSR